MADFGTRVEDYIGTFSDTDALDDWLTAGARLHVRILPPAEWQKYASSETDSGSGVTVSDKIVVSVDKGGYPSIEFPASFDQRLQDSDSIYEATTQSPAHVVKAGTLSIYPGGGNVETIGLPTVLNTDTAISVLPSDLEDATVLYTCLQALQKRIEDEVTSISTSGITVSTAPTYSAASKHADLEGDYDDVDTNLADDDVEVAGSTLNKVQTQLREFATDVEEAVAQYNSDITKWANDNQLETENERLKVGQFTQKIAQIANQVSLLSQQYQNILSPYMQRGDL